MDVVNNNVRGVLARFDTVGALLEAAKKMREAGYEKYDCHSPFPIHGMDQAMGLKRSPVGYIAGVCGFIGGAFGLWLQYWTSTVDYRLVISGKPFFSFPAYIPVTFGLTILFAAIGAFLGMLILNRLPQLYHDLFHSDNFSRVTDDGLFVSVESSDKKFDETDTSMFLESIGGREVELLREPV